MGAAIFFLAFLIFICYLFFSIVRDVIHYFFGYSINPIRQKLSVAQSAVLQKHFPYYIALSDKEKKIFQKRVRYFIASKNFVPRQMSRVTDEMKIMIGACAVQLTFGLPPLKLVYFKNIIVYPDRYTASSGKKHKGEVNTKVKAVVLSWKDFIEGYATVDDSYNVGLHEFAHALKVEDAIRNEEFDFFDTRLISDLHREFKRLEHQLNAGSHSLIRSYAGRNFDEFFAVCVEYFFEKPEELYLHERELFAILRLMLKQNPLV